MTRALLLQTFTKTITGSKQIHKASSMPLSKATVKLNKCE